MLLSRLYVDVRAVKAEALWDSPRLEPVFFLFSLSPLHWNLLLPFLTPMTSSFHREWGKAEGENEKEKSRDRALCVRHRGICVCVWLECEWAWHGEWEMSMFHTMTTNVPIHYCSTSSMCSASAVWTRTCLPLSCLFSLPICGQMWTDVSAVRSMSSSVCTTWPVKHTDINMTWVHVWVARQTVLHILALKVAV